MEKTALDDAGNDGYLMAYIEQHGSGWRVSWRTGGRGSPRRHSRTFDSKVEAEDARRGVERDQLLRRDLLPGEVILLTDLVDRYCLAHAGTTELHRDQFRRTVPPLIDAKGWTSTSDIQVAAIAGLKTHQARHLRALLRYAADLGQQVDQRVIAHLRPGPRARQALHLVDDRAIAGLLTRIEARHAPTAILAHLVASYGHRAQSLIELAWDDLDLVAGTIALRVKSGDRIRHPLLPQTVALVKRHKRILPTTPPLLRAPTGCPWRHGSEVAAWIAHGPGRADPAHGIEAIGILDLRRAAITRMMRHTGDPRTVAAITGHRTPSLLLNLYARTTDERQRQALVAIGAPAVPPQKTKAQKKHKAKKEAPGDS
jgi:integrase